MDDSEGQAWGQAPGFGLHFWVVCLFLLTVPACQDGASQPLRIPPAEVSVLTITPKTVPITFDLTGQTEASRDVEIRSQVGGLIERRFFKEGQDVRKGDALYLIDPVPFKAALRRAEAGVAEARSRLVGAQQTVARLKPLLERRATAQKDVDDALAQEGQARAALMAAEADLMKAQFDLKNTLVVAPLSGLIDKSKVPEGGLVAAQTDLLTTIRQMDPIYVNFTYSDTELLRVEAEVRAGLLAIPANNQWDVGLVMDDRSVYGERGALNYDARRVSSETGTIQGRAEFPNPGNKLLPGRFVHVIFRGATRPNAVLLPQRAVLEGREGPFVFVVDEKGKAEMRVVQTGASIGEDRLMTRGLGAGDKVIVEGVIKVRPGSPVTVTPASAIAAQAGSISTQSPL